MKSTIEQVEAAGLRKGLKVIIGGGQMDETVRKYTGADAYGDDAMAAVAFAKEDRGGEVRWPEKPWADMTADERLRRGSRSGETRAWSSPLRSTRPTTRPGWTVCSPQSSCVSPTGCR